MLGSRMAQGSDVIARVSTQFRMRPPFTRLSDRIPWVLWDTLSDESFSPKQTDGELMVLMCLRHGTPEEVRSFGGEPAVIFSRMLEDSAGTENHLVPDYFNGLVTQGAFLNRCRQMTWRTCGIVCASTPHICLSRPGGGAVMRAPQTRDWHLWGDGAPTRGNRTSQRSSTSTSRSTRRSTPEHSRMGIPSGKLRHCKC